MDRIPVSMSLMVIQKMNPKSFTRLLGFTFKGASFIVLCPGMMWGLSRS